MPPVVSTSLTAGLTEEPAAVKADGINTPSPSSPVPTPTSPPEIQDTPTPTGSIPGILVVADFDSCNPGANDLGEKMGATYTDTLGTQVIFSLLQNEDGSCSGRMEYEIYEWGGIWFRLGQEDLREYDRIAFRYRAEGNISQPSELKVELKKNCKEVGDEFICDQGSAKIQALEHSESWRDIQIRLEHFGPDGLHDPVDNFDGIEELVFIISNPDQPVSEQNNNPIRGTILIDDIVFLRRTDSAMVERQGIWISDFDSCMTINNQGGEMGIASFPGDRLTPSMVATLDGGCYLQLEYQIKEWAAYWMKLNRTNINHFTHLSFNIRAEPMGIVDYVQGIKLELSGGCVNAHCRYRSIYYLWEEIREDWLEISIPVEKFASPGWALGVDLDQVEEVIFTFESRYVGSRDVIFIDNVHFTEASY